MFNTIAEKLSAAHQGYKKQRAKIEKEEKARLVCHMKIHNPGYYELYKYDIHKWSIKQLRDTIGALGI